MSSIKKLLLVVLLVHGIFLAGRVWQEILVARAGVEAPTENGDVNADGDRDISDVLYMLFWLFRDGPAPVAIAGPLDLEARVDLLEGEIEAVRTSIPTAAEVAAEIAANHTDVIQGGIDPAGAAVDRLERTLGESVPSILSDNLELLDGGPVAENNIFVTVADSRFRVTGLHGREAMSRLFRFDLTLVDPTGSAVDDRAIVGRTAEMVFSREGAPVSIEGIVSHFGIAGRGEDGHRYRMRLVPELWMTTVASDLRTFQEQTIPEIIQGIFAENGIDAQVDLASSYPVREFCVQYRETDFHFASRLLEEEGIYYYFKHEDGDHRLILSDTSAGQANLPDVAIYSGEDTPAALEGTERILSLTEQETIVPEKVTLDDYNPLAPLTDLQATAGEDASNLELYDYPGEYSQRSDGVEKAGVRLEELDAKSRVFRGLSTIRSLRPGHRFTLQDRTESGFSGTYLLTSVEHLAVDVGTRERGTYYVNRFTCIPASTPFRPERVTPKPTVDATQTAVVVGPAGEEIHTDEHGRVKVHFHWDRTGAADDTASSWIRVAQDLAGRDHGTMHIPRVGDEVIVAFEHGDLRRPIVIGGLYNGVDRPPYALPGNRSISGFKSSSTPGGGSSNELRFEDKAGSEEVYLHGSKDLTIVAENAALVSALNLTINSDRTAVRGSLVSGTDAGPDAVVGPGQRHRDNSIVAWARIDARGALGEHEFGVLQVLHVGKGQYGIELDTPRRLELQLVPVVTPEVSRAPALPSDLRLASVARTGANTFEVFINSLEGPVDSPFVFLVTGR